MLKRNTSNVFAAFEMLMEEIETEIDLINTVGTRAMERRDYVEARAAIEHATQVTAFRDKVVALRKQWETLAKTQGGKAEEEISPLRRRNLGRLHMGLRTPEIAYYQPILEALNESGGSAEMNEVLERVEPLMRGILREVDYEPLASSSDMLRWRNAAQWARNTMVEEGLLKVDSPRGIWEIADAGRRSLAREGNTFSRTEEVNEQENFHSVKTHHAEFTKVIGAKPKAMSIFGQSFVVHTWRDVFERTMNTIIDRRPEKI